jgi:hypothetical protein
MGAPGKLSVEIANPTDWGLAGLRDGLPSPLPKPGQNLAAVQGVALQALIEAVPLSTWLSAEDRAPGEVLAALEGAYFHQLIVRSIGVAHQRFPEPAWSETLRRQRVENELRQMASFAAQVGKSSEAMATRIRKWRDGADPLDTLGYAAVRFVEAPWSEDFARRVFALALRPPERTDPAMPAYNAMLAMLGRHVSAVPPRLADELQASYAATELPPEHAERLAAFVDAVRFRAHMLKEIAP